MNFEVTNVSGLRNISPLLVYAPLVTKTRHLLLFSVHLKTMLMTEPASQTTHMELNKARE